MTTFHPASVVLTWPPEIVDIYLTGLYELIEAQGKLCAAAIDWQCNPLNTTGALLEALALYRLPKQEER